MRRNSILIIVCLLFVSAQAQNEKDTLKGSYEIMRGDFGVGSNAVPGKTAVKFIKVISDSRCPKKVTCIWPGEARILLGLYSGKTYSEKEIVLAGGEVEIKLGNGQSIVITELKPYPESGITIIQDEYFLGFSATLLK